MTYEQLTLPICPNVSVTAEDFHAKVSALLESGAVSEIQEALYSLKSCAWLKQESLSIYSLKMSEDYLTMMGGATFETIIRTMVQLGYGVEWQVLDSQYFGVPQHRERVFIIGHLGGICRRKVFPIGTDSEAPDKLQGHGDPDRVISNTLAAGDRDSVGTYVATDRQTDRQTFLKVNGYHRGGGGTVIGGTQAHSAWKTDGVAPTVVPFEPPLTIVKE